MDKPPEPARVLIVDDDPTQVDLHREILAMAGYRTETAASGAAAVARVRQDPPDLILLDVIMPDMDGLEVCQHQRGDARTAAVPILMVTGLDSPRNKERGLVTGAEDYVTKPVDPSDLLARIRAQVRVRRLRKALSASGGGVSRRIPRRRS